MNPRKAEAACLLLPLALVVPLLWHDVGASVLLPRVLSLEGLAALALGGAAFVLGARYFRPGYSVEPNRWGLVVGLAAIGIYFLGSVRSDDDPPLDGGRAPLSGRGHLHRGSLLRGRDLPCGRRGPRRRLGVRAGHAGRGPAGRLARDLHRRHLPIGSFHLSGSGRLRPLRRAHGKRRPVLRLLRQEPRPALGEADAREGGAAAPGVAGHIHARFGAASRVQRDAVRDKLHDLLHHGDTGPAPGNALPPGWRVANTTSATSAAETSMSYDLASARSSVSLLVTLSDTPYNYAFDRARELLQGLPDGHRGGGQPDAYGVRADEQRVGQLHRAVWSAPISYLSGGRVSTGSSASLRRSPPPRTTPTRAMTSWRSLSSLAAHGHPPVLEPPPRHHRDLCLGI